MRSLKIILSVPISRIVLLLVLVPGCKKDNEPTIVQNINSICPSSVVYAGKTYNTVLIGNQCWFKENLDVGTMISGSDSMKNNGTIEKYCYNDDPASCAAYGGLYQWDEAMRYSTIEGSQGICPNGWHIPTDAEFDTLSTAVGGDGNALKAIGQGTYEGAGTNTSGFSTLLAGYRNNNDVFDLIGYSFMWSSTQSDTAYADYMSVTDYDSRIIFYNNYKGLGFSVRCLKN